MQNSDDNALYDSETTVTDIQTYTHTSFYDFLLHFL